MHGRRSTINPRARLACKYLALPVPLCLACILALLFLLPAPSPAAQPNGGDVTWQYRDQRRGKQNPAASVVDSQGNVIITGSEIVPGSTSEQFYTVKIGRDGVPVWRGTYSKSGFNVRGTAVTVDAADNVYVTGLIDGANPNVYTIRYDRDQATATAVAAWQKEFDGGGIETATSIVASGGYVFVGGSSRYGGDECFMALKYAQADGTLALQIPNGTTHTIGKAHGIAADGSSIALTGQSWSGSNLYFTTIRFDQSGNLAWEKQYTVASPPQGFVYNDSGQAVGLDSSGNVIATGYVTNGANFDIKTINYKGADGSILWQQTYTGQNDDMPTSLYIDRDPASLDNVYVTGNTFNEARNHIYTAKYCNNADTAKCGAKNFGEKIWGTTFSSGYENHDIPAAVVADAASGNLFVVGFSEVDGNSDFRIVKYAKGSGAELWTRTFAGTANRSDRAVGVGLDSDGQPIVSGYADETAPLVNGSVTAAGASPHTVLVDTAQDWTGVNWAGYFVKMTGTNNGGEFRQIVSNTATTLTLATLLPNDMVSGDTYYIYNQDDYDYYAVKFEKGALEPPAHLVATTVSSGTVDLSWNDYNAVTPKFRVERCIGGTDNFVAMPCNFDVPGEITVIADGITATTAQDTGLAPDKYYYYRVRAYTGADFASALLVTYPSNIAHAVTQAVGSASPSKMYTYAGVANSDDYALAIAASPVDGKPVVTGKSFFDPGGFDYYTIRFDRDLNKLWSQRYNDPEGQSDVSVCLAIDHNNQIIVSGYAWLNNLAVQPNGVDMNAIYTIKYKADAPTEQPVYSDNDPELINQWAHQYNGPGAGDDRAVAIAATTDSSDNIAVVGMGLHSATDYQKHDMYVLHYPSNGPGTIASPNAGYWAATPIHKGDDNQPTAVAFDLWGNVIVTGFVGTLENPADPASTMHYRIYTAKFAAGSTNPAAPLWERTYDAAYGGANDVAVDSDGNIFVTGFVINGQGDSDFVTLKYDKDGTLQAGWPVVYDGPAHGDDEAVSIKMDPIDRNIVVAGNRLTDAGNNDVHVIHYRATDGAVIWQKTLLRESTDEDMFEMAMDPSGSIYITATTTNTGNLDPSTNKDILTFKVDGNGNIAGDATFYGTVDRLEKPYSITANKFGEVYVAGIAYNGASNADYIIQKLDGDSLQSPYPLSSVPRYSTVTLNWSDNSRTETGYQVARRDNACPGEPVPWLDGDIITTTGADVITYTDSGLTSGKTYCYGVRAKNDTGTTRWVNITVTTATPPGPLFNPNLYLDQPNGASDGVYGASPAILYGARASSTTSVRLTWGVPDYTQPASSYQIYRCTDSPGNTPCSDFATLSPQPVQTPVTQTVNTNFTSSYIVAEDSTTCPGAGYRYKIRATGTGWSADSPVMGVTLPTPDNLVVDGGFDSADPGYPWFSPVGSNLASEPPTFTPHLLFPDNSIFGAWGASGNGMKLTNDTSAVSAVSDWTRTTTPAAATVGAKVTTLSDTAPLVQQGWKSKRALTGLAANTVYYAQITRDATSTDGSEPQYGYLDLRIYDTVNNTELPTLFVSGMASTTVTVWFKTGANPSGIYAYFGNPTAPRSASALFSVGTTGRKQPVLVTTNGRYDFSARVKANLDRGVAYVNLSQQGYPYTISSGSVAANTDSRLVIDSSTNGGSNVLNRSFNKDGNWHLLSQTVTANWGSSPATNSYHYIRTYIGPSPCDYVGNTTCSTTSGTASGGTYYPAFNASGTAWIDDVRLVPNYNLTASTLNESQISLSWVNSSFDATGYKIDRCGTAPCDLAHPENWNPLTTVASATTTSYIDWGLTPGTSYSYRVYPYKSLPGACNGGWNNNPASVIPGTYSNVATAVSANNPPVLTATAPNTTQVNLSWTDPTSGDSEFQVVRGTGSDCAALSNLTTVPFTSTTYNDTDVCSGTSYSYCVKAVEKGLQYSDHTMWAPVTITNPQSNFQTKVTIAASQLPGIKSDFSDLRFYDATAGQQLPYWIESMTAGSSAVVWFKTNNAANKVYLYYGNPNAVSASDGSGVFEFFDGFDGTSLGAAWNKSISGAATITVSGGIVTLDASMNGYSNRTNYLTMSKGGLTPPYRLEARTSVSAANLGQGLIRIRGLGGIGDTGLHDFGNSIVQAVWNGSTTGKQIPTDTFVRWRADHLGGSANTWGIYQENGTVIYSTTYTGSPSGISISVGDGGAGNGKASFDWIVARKYAATEPVAVLGTPGPANAADLAGLTYGVIWESPFSKPTAGSPSSAPTIVTTPAKPGAPTISSAAGLSESQITVNWTFNPSIADHTGFDLDRCTASDCSTTGGNTVTTINIPDPAKRSYVDGGLAPSTGGTSYWYRIRAYKSGTGVCRWDTSNSGIVSGATKSMTALKPTGFTGKSGLDTNNLGAVSTNCDDIRVTRLENDSSETVLPIYLQNKNGGNAVCGQAATSVVTKVDLPVNASNTYYLYYGKGDAPTVSDGSRVFTFFDDFDSASLDATKWDLSNSTTTGFSLSSSTLVGSNSSGRLLSLAKFPPVGEAVPESSSQYVGYTLQVRAKGTTPPTNGFVPAGFFNSGTDHLGFRMGNSPVSLTATPPQFYYFDSGLSVQAASRPTGANDTDSIIYQVRARRSSTSSDMYLSMTDINLLTAGATTTYWDAGTLSSHVVTSAPIALGRRYDDNSGASYMNENYSASWEWVRVRKYASPGPSSAWVKDGSNNPVINTGTFSIGGVSGWKYQRPFTITNTAANALDLTGYEQNVPTIDTSTASTFPVTDHVTLTWADTTATEDGFAIYRCSAAAGQTCTPSGTLFTTIGPLYGTGGTVTYVDGATAANTAYCYTVRAYAGNVASPTWITDAPTAVCKTTYNPGAPTALSGSASGSRVDLVWTDNSLGESGYKIERCSGTGCNFSTLDTIDTANNRTYVLVPAVSNVKTNGSVIGQVAATSTDPPHAAFSDTGVGCSGVFRYRISAYFQADAGNTLPADPANAVATGDITVGTTPAAPAISSVNRNNEQQLTVNWTDGNSTKTGYQVYRCAGVGCTPATVVGTITNPATMSYVDLNGVVPGTTYGYAVRTKIPIDTSCNPDGFILSPASGTVYGVTSVTAPSSFNESITNSTQVSLSWSDSTASEAGYTIRRCTGTTVCTGDAWTIFTTALGAGSFNDTTTCSGTAYTYQITPNEQPSTLLSNNGGQAAWGKKAPLVINNFRANFVTRLTVNELPGMQQSSGVTNFNDIRFYDETAGAEIPYWIEYTSADTPAPKNIRVYIKTGTNNNIWLYYGNATATSASSKDAVFGSGLVGFWPFTGGATMCGGSNNVFPNFSAVNGPTPTAICNNTALQGVMSGTGVTGVTGMYTTGLQFDGSVGYVKVADPGAASALDITDQISIEVWYQYQKSPDWARIVSKSTTDGNQPWETYGLWLDNSSDAVATNPQQKIYFGIGSADSPPIGTAPYYQTTNGARLTPGQWYHIVGRYDSSTGNMSVVVNGTEYGLVNFAAKPKIINNNAPLFIGGRGIASTNFNPAKGIIDEVRLFNRALTNEEIATRYMNIPAGSTPSNLLPSVIVGPQAGKVEPVRVPLSFSAFQANSLGKIVISRDPANSVTYMTRADFRDVRLYDRDANREIPYWIRKITRDGSNNPVSAEIWFMTGATSAIDLSYGNSGDNNAAADLVGYWPFEESPVPYTTGQISDYSDWGMNGSLSGSFAAPFGIGAGGKYGSGLYLNGTSNYVSVTDTGYPNSPLDVSGSLTVETWFKYDKTTQTNSVLVGKANSAQSNSVVNPFMMYLRDVNPGDTTSRQITFRVSDGVDSHGNCAAVSSLGGVTLTDGDDGTWHHVVGRFDNTTTPATVTLFVDGVPANKNVDCGAITSVAVSSDPLTIGGQYWQSTVSGNFKGMIDEVRIYNRALSDPEILARASEGSTLQVATIATTPRAYWPFEETAPRTSGQTADMGGSGSIMNGTLNGFTTGNGIVATGKYGNGLKLNPAGSTYVSVPDTAITPIVNPLVNGGSMTAELWYYYDGVSDTKGMRLLSKLYPHGTADNQVYALYVQNSATTKTLVFLVGDATGKYVANDPATSFTFDGKPAGWYHIVGRYDAKQPTQQVTLYVNNVPYATQNAGNTNLTIGTSNELLTIGCRRNHSGGIDLCVPGTLDEVRIYNDALPDAEVGSHFASTAPAAVKAITPASSVVSITPVPGNVVRDPDFESNSSYWNGAWPNWSGISYGAPVPYSGWKSLKLTSSSTLLNYQGISGLIPGGTYTLSGYISASLGTGGSAYCHLENYATDVNYTSPAIQIDAADAARNNMGWISLSTTFTLPMTAPGGGSISQLNLACVITGAANTAWFDMVQLAPVAPQITATRVSEAAIDLNWKDIFGSDKTGYNIYRCMDSAENTPCSDFTNIRQVVPSELPYRDSGLQMGKTYRYRVTAYKTASCPWESAASNVASATTDQAAPVLQTPVVVNSTTIRLLWNDANVTETGYNIYRCMNTGCTPTEAFHNVPSTRQIDLGLKARYTFNGNVNDTSGNGLALTYSGTPTYEDNGIVLTSVSNLASSSTPALDADDHTIEFEMKFRGYNYYERNVFLYSPDGSTPSPGIYTATQSRLRLKWVYNAAGSGIDNIGIDGVNGTEFTLNKWYRIRGVKSGTSLKIYVNDTQVASATVVNPKPAGPASLIFGSGYNQASVAIRNFSIYAGADGTADPTLITYTDTQVCPETFYNYKVVANQQGGWGESAASSNVAGNTTPVFGPPTGITAKAATDTRIDLTWTANSYSDQNAFLLKECPGSSCTTAVQLANTPAASRTGLTGENQYCYQVASRKASTYCNGVGGGDATGITSVFAPGSPVCVVTTSNPPTTLTAVPLGSYKIQLEWFDESADEETFELQKKLWNGQWATRAVIVKDGVTGRHKRQYIDTLAIEPLKKFTYRLRAVRGADASPFSNEATAIPPVFTGGEDKATCICTGTGDNMVCQ